MSSLSLVRPGRRDLDCFMAGKPGIRNLIGVRGRTKGGQSAPLIAPLTPDSLAGCSAAFLTHLATRAYSAQSIDSHRWALKGFIEWAETQGLSSPASFPREIGVSGNFVKICTLTPIFPAQ